AEICDLTVAVEHREDPPTPFLLAPYARHPVCKGNGVRSAQRRDCGRGQAAGILEPLHLRRGELLVARVRALIVGLILYRRPRRIIPQRRTAPERESNHECSGDDGRAHRPQKILGPQIPGPNCPYMRNCKELPPTCTARRSSRW